MPIALEVFKPQQDALQLARRALDDHMALPILDQVERHRAEFDVC
jgi:hypothetical protein